MDRASEDSPPRPAEERQSSCDAPSAPPGPRPLFFFGLPGSGKTHCGQLAARELGFAFHDGDHWLPDDLRASLARKEGFTDEQRGRYAQEVADRMLEARKAEAAAATEDAPARPLAVAQAMFKRRYREVIRAMHPDTLFVYVCADEEARLERLRKGGNLVDTELGRRMARDFEPPEEAGSGAEAGDESGAAEVRRGAAIDNGSGVGEEQLLEQLRAIATPSPASPRKRAKI